MSNDNSKRLELDASDAKILYSALLMAHETITEGLKEPKVRAEYSTEQLAELEERAFRYADLIEKFKDTMQ